MGPLPLPPPAPVWPPYVPRNAAMDDPLIAAMVGKLPAPAHGAYSRAQRINWLKMMVMAFNEAYGVEEPIVVADLHTEPRKPLVIAPGEELAPESLTAPRLRKLSSHVTAEHIAAAQYRIDSQGFALLGEQPIDPDDVPPGAELVDERPALECGDLSTVLWKTSGSIAADKLPQIKLRAA